MNLLMVTGFWPTQENTISGVFVVQQIAALIRGGCRLTVIVPSSILRRHGGACMPIELGLDTSHLNFIESPFLRLPEKFGVLPGVPAINNFNCGAKIQSVLRTRIDPDGFDGCIVHGLRGVGLSLPMWRSYVSGKVALVLHGVDPFFREQTNVTRLRKLLDNASTQSDAVVLVGRPLLAHANFLGLEQEKLRVVPNGTRLPPMTEVSFRQRSRTERRRVVSVSNLVALKGIDDNLHALAALVQHYPDLDWEYRVIGDGPERNALMDLACRLGISDRVQFLGRLPYEATMDQIAQCDVFSLPSWGEAFGIVYLEAMAHGRVPIGCRDNGAADIITDKVDGLLVEPRNQVELENALFDLLCDPQRTNRLGMAARTTAEKFSWDANARNMLNLLSAQSVEGN
ncbi:MAG: glycosyltransferase family 4 protein [Methylococcaceae bacterium]|nr:glycosyltransferase family 4 protein [Methylococcaceae bacterium]